MRWKKKKKMYKKIAKVFGKTVSTALLLIVFLANQAQLIGAYEAHVINVTAKIENRCQEPFSISGVKFNDKNKNQIQDPGEEGLSGWIIVLSKGPYEAQFDYDNSGYINGDDRVILQKVVNAEISCPLAKQCDINNDTLVDASDVTAFTNYINSKDLGNKSTAADGTYSFTGEFITQGPYVIYEVPKENWTNSTPSVKYFEILECGNNTVNFGNYQGEVEISCGDGIINQLSEECDDGNNISGDGCSAECKTEACLNPLVLDFDTDGAGNPIVRGQIVDNEYSAYGITVKGHNYNGAHPQIAITFDSSNPTGAINGDRIKDVDLGTPNIMYAGPGMSETGDNKEPSNSLALHNVLILPDNAVDTTPADGNIDDPNDEPAGGSLSFIFDREYTFSSVKYIDLDWSTGEVVGYSNATGTVQAFSIPVPKGTGNSVQTIAGDETTKIRNLKLRGRDSYAIDEVRLCLVTQCGNETVETGEQCDDGNRIDGDGCDNTCKITNYCGDGTIQTPNSFEQNEECDDGENNGTLESQCTTQCTTKKNECDAKSPGYYKNNDGCQNGTGESAWADEVNVLSDTYFDVFQAMTGTQMCVVLGNSSCNTGTDVERARCRATWHLLADEMNSVGGHLRPDALVAGGDDGNTAFDTLGISATSTISQAMSIIENIIADTNSTKDNLNRAQYIASRIYGWYENENPQKSECVLPGFGNGVLETGEQCDDGNLIPWDGCSPLGISEVVLNEILPNPAGSDNAPMPNGEWVELYNLSPKPISLNGWALYDSIDTHELLITDANTDLATTTIPSLGRLVVFRNESTIFELTNTKDIVRLFNKKITLGGNSNDVFSWTSSKGEGLSYARVPDGTGDWVDPCPTPGGENTIEMCVENIVETIDQSLAVPPEPIIEEEIEIEDVADPADDAANFPESYWIDLMGEESRFQNDARLVNEIQPMPEIPEAMQDQLTATSTSTTTDSIINETQEPIIEENAPVPTENEIPIEAPEEVDDPEQAILSNNEQQDEVPIELTIIPPPPPDPDEVI